MRLQAGGIASSFSQTFIARLLTDAILKCLAGLLARLNEARGNLLVGGGYFPYRVASATLLLIVVLDTVPFISQPAVLSILCREVELGIPSVEKRRGVSILREEEPPQAKGRLQSRIEIIIIIRCRANYRWREPISRERGHYATPGPTIYEQLPSSLPLPPGSPRERDALGTRPRAWAMRVQCDFSG